MKTKTVTLTLGALIALSLNQSAEANVALKGVYKMLDAKSQKYIGMRACEYAKAVQKTSQSTDYQNDHQRGLSISYELSDAIKELQITAPIKSYAVRLVLEEAKKDALKGDIDPAIHLANTTLDVANCGQ